jgi:dihydrofolate reductase
MRKLKLQMHMSLDGIVGGTKDSGTTFWDAELRKDSIDNLSDVDTILIGSHTAADLITYWGKVAEDLSDEDYELGKRITEIPKVVFSKKMTVSSWPNATVINGQLKNEIEHLKNLQGENMLVYGGAGFVSSLIKENLIDEYDLLVHPEIAGKGLKIFDDVDDILQLKLIEAREFSCGVVLLKYGKKEVK